MWTTKNVRWVRSCICFGALAAGFVLPTAIILPFGEWLPVLVWPGFFLWALGCMLLAHYTAAPAVHPTQLQGAQGDSQLNRRLGRMASISSASLILASFALSALCLLIIWEGLHGLPELIDVLFALVLYGSLVMFLPAVAAALLVGVAGLIIPMVGGVRRRVWCHANAKAAVATNGLVCALVLVGLIPATLLSAVMAINELLL